MDLSVRRTENERGVDAMTDSGVGTDAASLVSGAVGSWVLDTSATTVSLGTKAMWGLAKVKGTLSAAEGSGTVTPEGTVTGKLVVDASSINTKSAKRDEHLKGSDFFEVEKYPTFTYEATSATVAADGKVTLDGTLTVRDQTHPLALVATVSGAGSDVLTVQADSEIDRSKWGVAWAKMGAGLIIKLSISAKFTKVA